MKQQLLILGPLLLLSGGSLYALKHLSDTVLYLFLFLAVLWVAIAYWTDGFSFSHTVPFKKRFLRGFVRFLAGLCLILVIYLNNLAWAGLISQDWVLLPIAVSLILTFTMGYFEGK